MKDERTDTWNPYTLPENPQTPDWRPAPSPDTSPLEQPVRFEPKA
jgi:hypothetical protein